MAQQPQSDPWVEAAKNYKAQPQSGGAPAPTENEDWKIWQEQAPEDTRNGVQKGFDALTTVDPNTPKLIKPFAEFGAGVMDAARPVFHPIETAQHVFSPQGLTELATPGIQLVKSLMNNPARTLGGATGQALVGEGAARAAEPVLSKISSTLRPAPDPNIVAPEEIHAAKLAQSILPPGGIKPELLRNVQEEVPAVKAYAKRTGNPLTTQVEGLKAAQGVGQEGLQHFNENFLKPNQDVHVDLPAGLSPELKTSTTIGKLNQRISDINDMMRSAQANAKSAGESMTAQERLGLENEAKGLRQKLYDSLSQKTGVAGPDIRTLREGYGGEFGLANALESARNARLTRVGQESQGNTVSEAKGRISGIPPCGRCRLCAVASKQLQIASLRIASSHLENRNPSDRCRKVFCRTQCLRGIFLMYHQGKQCQRWRDYGQFRLT